MDGRDVKLHLRNQERIIKELSRLADAVEDLVKVQDIRRNGYVHTATGIYRKIQKNTEEDTENEGTN